MNGDSPAVITQRIREALSIWAEDAEHVSTLPRQEIISATAIRMIPQVALHPRATRLPPVNRARCARSSSMLPAGCRQANKFVSLSPAYKTKFVPVKDDDGRWKSSVYFECHYFDVSLDPATGLPLWTAESHVDLDGEAKKINGRWLLTHVSSSAVSVPVP